MSLWPRGRAEDASPARAESEPRALAIAENPFAAIAAAVAIVLAAASFRMVFLGELGTRLAFLTFYPAVALAALLGGFWPGVIATALSAALAEYLWLTPFDAPRIAEPADMVALPIFGVGGLIVSWTAELSKRAHRAASRAQASRREEVESLVLRRTAELAKTSEALRAEISVRRALEERFRQVIESAPSAMIMIDGQGVIELVNVQAELVFGYSRQELLGRSIDILLPERFRAGHLAHRGAYLAAPTQRAMGVGHDLFGLRKDGGEFPLEIGLNPLQTPEGVKIVSSIVDISKRKEMERALSESEERMRLMFDSIRDHAIVMLDVDGRVVGWNAGAERVVGYRKDEVLGRHHSLFYSPEDLEEEELARKLAVAAAEGRVEYEGWHVRRDEVRFLANVTINAVRGPQGNLQGFVKVTRDITERKRIETELIETNERFALAAEAAGMGFYDFDFESQDARWDDQMYRIYGVSPESGEEAYALWKQGLHPDDLDAAQERIHDAITSIRAYNYEFRIVRPGGEIRHLRGAASVKVDPATGRRRMFGLNFDITDRKRIETELIETNERFALAAEAAGMGFYDLDIETQAARWDDQMYRLFGVAPETREDPNALWGQGVHPDDIEAARERVREAIAHSQTFNYEYRVVRQEGAVRHIRGVSAVKSDPATGRKRLFGLAFDVTERKRIETELIEANERFVLAARSARLGVWDLDLGSFSLRWDDQMFEIYGHERVEEAQINPLWRRTLHPDDKEKAEAAVRGAMAGGLYHETDFRIVRPDGEIRHLRGAASLQRDSSGVPTRLVGINFDITERKRIENELMDANDRFVLAAEAGGLGVWEYDLEAGTLRWEHKMYRLYGLEPVDGEQPYALWTRGIHPDDRARAEEVSRAAIEGERDYQTEFRVVWPDGSVRHLGAAASFRRNPEGRATRMVGINFDITERKRIETELIEANERFALAAEAAGLGFYDLDIESRTSRWDDQMFRLYGVSPGSEEQPYAVWKRSIHPDDQAAADRRMRDAMTQSQAQNYEFRIVRPDGAIRHMRGAATTKRDPATGHRRMFGLNFDITERKRIETELLGSNERFLVAAEAAGLGFWEYDVTAKTVRWDERMFKIRGAEPVVGNHYGIRYSYVHADDRARVEHDLQEAAEGRKKFNCEYRIVLADGRVRHMKSAANLQGDPASGNARLLGVSFDVTERMEIEEQLIQSNLRFALASEAGELGFWEYNLEAQTLLCDNQLFKIYGIPRSDGPQSFALWMERLHPDDRARVEEEVRKTAEGTRKFNTEFRIVWPDGSVRHLRAAATLLHDSKTGTARMFGVNFDITELKRIESKLLEANERFVLAAEAAGLGFWDYDIETKLSHWDDQMFRLYGVPRGTPLDLENRMKLLHPGDRERVVQELLDAAAGLRSFDSENRVVRPDGKVRHFRSAASLKRDPDGRAVRLLGVSFDITDRKEALEALEQARDAAEAANRAKSEFLAVMSHEIRTPMNGIMGMNALLNDTKLTKRQKRMTETIRDSAQSLLTIIDDILDISKLEAGKIDVEYVDFSLPHLIDKTVELFRPRAEQKGLSLSADATAVERAALRGDESRLRQITLNLISNAIKFTPSGSVTVMASTTDADDLRTRVRFEVRDTGPGVGEEAKKRLFKPFEQADSSISRRFGGTGLGLSICKRLVEVMGGQIGVTDREGGGSIFWFELVLPRAAAAFAAQPARAGETVAKANETHSGRILLAEDNAINIEVATMILEGAGYTVDVAVDGNEALSAIRRHDYDLVLMDVQMPRLDGLAATREIRASERQGEHVPIIAMTANAMKEDQRRCLEAGMDDYFSKPFQPSRLIEKVARWMERFGTPETAKQLPLPAGIETLPVVDSGAVEQLLACFPRNRFDVLLGRFLGELENDKEAYPRLAHASALPELGQAAHKLVASAGHFGARQVQQLAMDLQAACEAGDDASVAALLDRLAPASDAATAALREKYPLPTLH